MVDKRGLQTLPATAGLVGAAFGTLIPDNMRRYIYRVKTSNQFAGPNQLNLGYSDDLGVTHTDIDYIDHAVQYEMWVDPDELKEDSAPIYIIPGGNQIYLETDAGNIECYFLYEDSE